MQSVHTTVSGRACGTYLLKGIRIKTNLPARFGPLATSVPQSRNCCRSDLHNNEIAEVAVPLTVGWWSKKGGTVQVSTSAREGCTVLLRNDGVLTRL